MNQIVGWDQIVGQIASFTGPSGETRPGFVWQPPTLTQPGFWRRPRAGEMETGQLTHVEAARFDAPPAYTAEGRPLYTHAAQQAQLAKQRAIEAAAAVKQTQGSVLVRSEGYAEGRTLVIGFEFLAIAAGASATVTQRPQVLFRPQRVVVPSAVAPNFTITDIKVGNKSQLVSSGPVPAEAFAQTSFGVQMKMDTCQVSMDLIIEVTNISGAQDDFRAAMYGSAAY